MTYQYHDESIVKSLPENTVFVFGSNMAGLHAGGAARTALEHFGAVEGVGRGWSGQSYAIPTMNEHLQQMPLSQIQHYIDDFKIYTKNHPKNNYFLTSVGCGIAGYKVEEIAPMFKGISHNVIFPQSFRPFVEKPLPKLNEKFLKTIFRDSIIFADPTDELIEVLAVTDSEKSLAKILLNTQMYPTDSNGRDRVFEIQDILHNLNGKVFDFQNNSEGPMVFGGVILALLELYNINEQDFSDVWHGKREIAPPKPENKSRRNLL
ncbi:A1S_2505 family phage non-structural protein [Acinetobacter schindleri]|jgi:hypothetical protein|uniref:Uncharacterized protein n=1 Tax=Acinetobacter schindleri NIPH 900 TaxID=1217675 RepID=N8XS88_9GAMM|nr:hypothetical protein [Acinetobacter schindleri]APX62400.1 hypothetical protein AsACE_CH00982 [Acinetobacter schindleri]AWD70931.1 hypothetical protein C0119_12290 [Acinetobacter schindleri]ENV11914.1 hypothetical protein F965_02926 [Acinetobacter schindleri NIPH 900]MBB4836565.1 hypothetical protein [Acinetobacter schindleri]MDP1445086.1 hypothetical protein [Acinetobacter schindleri]